MRRLFYPGIFLLTILACDAERQEQPQTKEHSTQQIKDCPPGRDTINIVTTFTRGSAEIPTDKFYSIVNFITNKEFFKPSIHKTGKLKSETGTSKRFVVAYDTCNMKRWITKNFIIKNIQVTSLDFTGRKKDKYTGFIPRLHFEEWKFASNKDRDSAMKIVKTVYTYPNNIVMYEKRYSQFLLDDKRVFLLEAGAKFAESYAIEYKKLIDQFIKTNYSNR